MDEAALLVGEESGRRIAGRGLVPIGAVPRYEIGEAVAGDLDDVCHLLPPKPSWNSAAQVAFAPWKQRRRSETMKYFLAALGGMVITLFVFVGGAAFAIKYLAAEPVPVQRATVAPEAVMPANPARKDTAEQDFRRVERRPAPEPSPQDRVIELDVDPMPEFDREPIPEIDDLTTASVGEPDEPEPQPVEPVSISNDHVAWCSDRYRSYRPESNSYTSYSGEIRECVSPFSGANAAAPDDEEGVYIEASVAEPSYASAGGPSPEHIESCFSRYRSYRPEDNTYQPYGGGPRRQCE